MKSADIDQAANESMLSRGVRYLPRLELSALFYFVVAGLLYVQALLERELLPASFLSLLSIGIASLIVVNGFLSILNLRAIGLRCETPASATAGKPFKVSCLVSNRRRVSGAPMLRMELRGSRGFHQREAHSLATYVKPISQQRVQCSGVFLRRGTQYIMEATIKSSFPFGL
ncbi:MAG: hypothetical protein KDB07_12970, partial [Planctomycetes bacterium]|nr:hypothetical protein [Planctomycetota bacterium]